MDAEDSISTWLCECCSWDPNAWESSTALFASWSVWARQAGEAIGSQKAFVQTLENGRGLKAARKKISSGFQGASLNPTASPSYGYKDD